MQSVLEDTYFYPNCQHHHSVDHPNLHSTYMQHVALLLGQLLSLRLRYGCFMFCLIENVIAKICE